VCPIPRPFATTMPGARRREAAGPQPGAHLELRLEPFVWQLLGLSESDENGRTEPNIGYSALALFHGNGQPLYGRLATDRPHQAKAQVIYAAPFGVNVGVFQSVASGLPVSRFAALSPGSFRCLTQPGAARAPPRRCHKPT
jgi:hypothetical protein